LKIKIPWYTWVYLCIFLISGYSRVVIYCFLLLTIHEGCHILMAILLRRKIRTLIIYPIGIGMEIEALEYMPSIYEFTIALAGPLSIYISTSILYLLNHINILTNHQYMYLQDMNINLFLFNMLPIYPLDAGRMLHAILHILFPYKVAYILTMILSVIFLRLLSHLFDPSILILYLSILCIFLISNIITVSKKIYSFHLYRYLYPIHTSHTRLNHTNILYRNIVSIFPKKFMSEKEYLKSIFERHI